LDFIQGGLRVFRPPQERCFLPQAIKSILSVVEKRPNDTRYTHFPACVRTTTIYFRYFPNYTSVRRVKTLISRNTIFHVSRVVSFALLMVLVDELRVKLFSTRSVFLIAEKTLLPFDQPSTSRVAKHGDTAKRGSLHGCTSCDVHTTVFRTSIARINF